MRDRHWRPGASYGVRCIMLAMVVLAAAFALIGCQTLGSSVSFGSSRIDSSGTSVSALLFKPEGPGPFPAVVLLHTCGGYQVHVTRDWPEYLTGLGYVVMTPNSYQARGYSLCSERKRGIWRMAQSADAFGALEYLRTLSYVDGERVAAIGFSAGGFSVNQDIAEGRSTWRMPNTFKAAIAFYAGCQSLLYATPDDDLALLQIVAEKDTRLAASCIRAAEVRQLDIHVIEGAYHAFDQPQITSLRHDNGGNPMLYSYSAVQEAQEVVRAFLARHLR